MPDVERTVAAIRDVERFSQDLSDIAEGRPLDLGIGIVTRTVPRSLEDQTAIAPVLSGLDAEVDALKQRRAKTADLKQAMMQELLTGKTGLVTPEAINA